MRSSLKSVPTSAEVARRAGVSRTTVSFVLNGVDDKGISKATRERVLQASRELGYQPNAAARSLAGGATGTVALVIPRATHLYVDAYLGRLAASINEECHRQQLRMLIEASEEEGRAAGAFVDLVRTRRIDGLIVINPNEEGQAHLGDIVDAGIPMVVFGAGLPDESRYHSVGSNTSDAAGLAVGHLIGLGHREIAFVNFAPAGFLAGSERERGWRRAMADHGLPVNPAWCAHADISADSGYRATQELLARGVRFTALFAGNDTVAFGALRALREAGLKVPQDVAVVGYDDIPLAAYAEPALTTVRTDPIGLGRDAMRILVGLLQGEDVHLGERQEQAPALVVRASCGAGVGPATSP